MLPVPQKNLPRWRRAVRELSPEEARAYFEEEARRCLGMSAEEFVVAWEAGEFGDDPDDRPEVMDVAFLLGWYGDVAAYGSKRARSGDGTAEPRSDMVQWERTQEEAAMIQTERPPKKVGRTRKPQWRDLSAAEARELFDREARRKMGISGDEFARAWYAGEFDDAPDRPDVMSVAMLLGFYHAGDPEP